MEEVGAVVLSEDEDGTGGSERPGTAPDQERNGVPGDTRFVMRIGARRPWAMGLMAADEDLSDSMERVELR